MISNTAFIFPGQGSQYAGMGKEFFDTFAEAREVFAEVDEAVGFRLSNLCFSGPDEVLRLTENTQPAIVAASAACLRVLSSLGYRADFVAGHSLGEYSALVAAGSLALRDAVRLVRFRGRYMQDAVPVGKGAMAAVIGLSSQAVTDVCREASNLGVVSPANFNAPDQVVIAGETRAVAEASERLKQKGARRVLPLPVSAPFHCSLMAGARDRLEPALNATDFTDLRIPLVCNVDAAEVRSGEEARSALIRQVCAPVRWVESVEYLVTCGVDTFIEVGPRNVLSGLVRKITPQSRVTHVDSIRGIEALASLKPGATM